jgi:hypothetical protein
VRTLGPRLVPGSSRGGGAGGDDHRIEADLGVDVLALDAHGVAVDEDSLAFVFVDVVLAHEESQPAHPFHGDLAGAFERRVVAHGGGAFDAERVGVGPQKVGDRGVAQQRFRRDASNVQTHPTPVVGVDDGHRQTELRGADGGHVAPRTRAEHYDVIPHGSALSVGACAVVEASPSRSI